MLLNFDNGFIQIWSDFCIVKKLKLISSPWTPWQHTSIIHCKSENIYNNAGASIIPQTREVNSICTVIKCSMLFMPCSCQVKFYH